MADSLNIVLLEPYSGGSHAAFNESLIEHSRHHYELITLPARKWKWRMRGAAIWFAQDGNNWMPLPSSKDGGGGGDRAVDLILTNDMLSVADLRALLPPHLASVPIVCYFHENQLTYPVPNEADRDYQYGMTNITSCLTADSVWFNSHYHLEAFLKAADSLLRRMPDFVPKRVADSIRSKSRVLYPPVDVPDELASPAKPTDRPLTILWCHRWEYDKNPEPFFEALLELDSRGLPFELVLLGEQFRTAPAVFESSWERLRRHIVHAGFMPDRQQYLQQLVQCDLVVSTAIQENFGIAVVEAILAGCQPLLPNRLAYPELIPEKWRRVCLYDGDDQLFERLHRAITGPGRLAPNDLQKLKVAVRGRFNAVQAVELLDNACLSVVDR